MAVVAAAAAAPRSSVSISIVAAAAAAVTVAGAAAVDPAVDPVVRARLFPLSTAASTPPAWPMDSVGVVLPGAGGTPKEGILAQLAPQGRDWVAVAVAESVVVTWRVSVREGGEGGNPAQRGCADGT